MTNNSSFTRTIQGATQALQESVQRAGGSIRDVSASVDDYVHDYPWLAIASAIAVAGTLGFIAGATVSRRKQRPG